MPSLNVVWEHSIGFWPRRKNESHSHRVPACGPGSHARLASQIFHREKDGLIRETTVPWLMPLPNQFEYEDEIGAALEMYCEALNSL